MATLIEVLDANRAIQRRAHALNATLGTRRFPAKTLTELTAFAAERLQGAALCVSDVIDPEILRLPALDPNEVARAEQEVELTRQNEQQWLAWHTRPTIVMPDIDVDHPNIPIEEVAYGTCAINGTPLIAYGTFKCLNGVFKYNASVWSESATFIEPVWHRSLEEAETTRKDFLRALPAIREKLRAARDEQALEAKMAELKKRLHAYVSECTKWPDLQADARQEADRFVSHLAFTRDVEAHVRRMEFLIKEIEEHIEQEQASEAAERAANQVIADVIGDHQSALEALAVAKALTRAFNGRKESAIEFLQEVIGNDKGARRKLDAVRGKLGNMIGTRDRGFRFYQQSKAPDIVRWLAGILTALTGVAPDGTPKALVEEVNGLPLDVLRRHFGK